MIQDREDVLPQCKIIVTKENVKYTYCYGFPLRGLSCLKFVEKLSVVILQKLDTETEANPPPPNSNILPSQSMAEE